jgi:thioredoxin-related protein
MNRIILLIGLAVVLAGSTSLTTDRAAEESPVKWLTIEQALEQSKTTRKPIFIDVYTTWCGWCKVMDKNTFSDPLVAKMLNEQFYPVKFDGEQKADVVFNGTTYKYVGDGSRGYHQLAAALLNNQLSYPTVVFLDENFQLLLPLQGYRKAPEFLPIATYIGEGHFKKIAWQEFEKQYKSPY